MAHKSSDYVLIPSASRLVNSLRDMGYDFSAAVADLVDNSIEAGATLVKIDVEFDGDNSWLRIADNGKGMTAEQLIEAMRYGSEREYDELDLGKFGLGLKTASLSQCQKLSVASRIKRKESVITAFCWDLAHIEETNRWEIIPLNGGGIHRRLRLPLRATPGTVVLWERLDRILGYKHPYGEPAFRRLSSMCRELEQHLAMVFHRFLSGEVPKKHIKIQVNGNQVRPWDPFARQEAKLKKFPTTRIAMEYEGKEGIIKLEPFVLPHQEEFSSAGAFRLASGPANWNQQQGFYIYRSNRLIQSGGWSRLRTADEHTKLARIALSFSPVLDDAFKINVSKMRVQLPAQVRDQVEEAIRPVIRIAQETYRKKTARRPSNASGSSVSLDGGPLPEDGADTPLEGGYNSTITLQPTSEQPITKYWSLDELQPELEQIARREERPIVTRVLARFRKKINA